MAPAIFELNPINPTMQYFSIWRQEFKFKCAAQNVLGERRKNKFTLYFQGLSRTVEIDRELAGTYSDENKLNKFKKGHRCVDKSGAIRTMVRRDKM